jgi:hypothetical protein
MILHRAEPDQFAQSFGQPQRPHVHPRQWSPALQHPATTFTHACPVAFWRGVGLKERKWRRSMDILNLIIQLVSGAVGGNVAGNLSRNIDLGPLGNTVTGALGGGLGGYVLTGLLGLAAVRAGGLDIGTFISACLTGGVSGGVLTAILGLLRAQLPR